MKERKNKIISLWNIFAIMIFVGFFVFCMILGGSASNGYQEAGKYYVGEHGAYTEVSETVWLISSVWEILFFVSLILTMIINAAYQSSKRR